MLLIGGMILDAVLSRFIEHSPVTVMARLALGRALEPRWLEALFEEHGEQQYTRELLFSSVVDIMTTVAVGLQPSVHAAAQARKDLPVSLAALYSKINNTAPSLARALVMGSAQRLQPVVEQLRGEQAPLCPGYRIRVLDGNHLPASEKRLAALRGFRGAALPGHSLVVYDPDAGMVVDLVACEDAHAQERTLMPSLQPMAQPGELWIADRNFSTTGILSAWHQRGVAFVIREHGSSPNPTVLGKLRKVGRVENGTVYEQEVEIGAGADAFRLRRIEVHLEQPTADGETVIRILSNLPGTKSAEQIASLYRRRWSIEGMFQWLESVLNSEIKTLGYPRAALFAFSVAILAFNALSAIQTAIERQHGIDQQGNGAISLYYIAHEIRTTYQGMMIAVPNDAWSAYLDLPDKELSHALLDVAGHVNPKTLRKHPRTAKKAPNKGSAPLRVVSQHVATARVLAGRRPT
jgi:IS4 transposase